MTELDEVFFANGNVEDGEGGDPYIWKTVLTEGRLELTPGPGGKKVKKPLVIVDGHSSDPTKAIGLADLLDSFEKGVFQHVTVPTSHANQVTENTGFVRQMRLAQEDGKNVLQAAFEFTEPEIREKVRRGTIANVSCGILRNYEKPRDGSTHSAVIEHIALTNKPWVDGMTPFFNRLSDDEGVAEGYHFADQSEEDALNFEYIHKGRDDSAIVKKGWLKRRAMSYVEEHHRVGSKMPHLAAAKQAFAYQETAKVDPAYADYKNAVQEHISALSDSARKQTVNEANESGHNGPHIQAIHNAVATHEHAEKMSKDSTKDGDGKDSEGKGDNDNPVKTASDKRKMARKRLAATPTKKFDKRVNKDIGKAIKKQKDMQHLSEPELALAIAAERRLNLTAYGDASKGDMFDYSAKGYEDITDSGSTLVKWDDTTGMVGRQHAIEDTLDTDFPDYMLLDYSGGRVLIEDEDGTRYIAGYRMKDDGTVELHPQAEWQKLSDNRSELSDDNTEGG